LSIPERFFGLGPQNDKSANGTLSRICIAGSSPPAIGSTHSALLESFLRTGRTGHLELPGLALEITGDAVFLRAGPEAAEMEEITIHAPGIFDLPGVGTITISMSKGPFEAPSLTLPQRGRGKDITLPRKRGREGWGTPASHPGESLDTEAFGEWTALLDAAKLDFPLTIRQRKPGDRFQPLGMKDSKKVQDFLVDLKVPRHHRDLVPLLISGDKILAVLGHRISESARLEEGTERGIRVRFRRS